ncbi:MAG: DUF5333 domain-containing protein [Pseudomonadota bacterium]
MTQILIASIFAASLVAAGPAAAKPGLAKEKAINDQLFPFALAFEIQKKCSDIQPRMLRALSYRNSLFSAARARGYSNAEIDAYIDNKAAQQRMRERGNAYLARYNASLSDRPALCRAGRQEIKNNSQIGRLLRAR